MIFKKHERYPLKLILYTKLHSKERKNTKKPSTSAFSDACHVISSKLHALSNLILEADRFPSKEMKELIDELLKLKRMEVNMAVPLSVIEMLDDGKDFDAIFNEREKEELEERKENVKKEERTNTFYEKLDKLNLTLKR
ncbi:hypothetical protein THOM_1793 [Trachipleistophora hominis]|uniref:Uncharacterized protein n=1 Tax=Trachipleistophora hominis TaxID=72359 RepID=L7JW72_TRAHO|nr:hypothetical protein THOM_1793 [Trachipleistophora hominis]